MNIALVIIDLGFHSVRSRAFGKGGIEGSYEKSVLWLSSVVSVVWVGKSQMAMWSQKVPSSPVVPPG